MSTPNFKAIPLTVEEFPPAETILPGPPDIHDQIIVLSPELHSTPDKLDLRIDGSIDLGSGWNVRDSINKIGQSLRQANRDVVKVDKENVQYEGIDNKWEKDGPDKEEHWVSSVFRQPNDRTLEGDTTQRGVSYNRETNESGKDSSENGDKRDNVDWDNPINENVQRQGGGASETLDKRDKVPQKKQKDNIVGYTQFERMKTTDHKVKDVARTKEFSVHLFKQTMQVFDSIKRKMSDDDMKAKVDDMARSYKDQFGQFVRRQRETAVRTKMGDQRAILHTMDTSNLILQRLVNFLKADMENVEIGRTNDNTLQREVDAARDLEYKHVCSKYGYCRTDKGFTMMLQTCIKKIISVDDEKMYRARDAVTEVLKTADYSKLIDSKTDKTFKKKINRLEKKEPDDIREGLKVLLGMLSNAQTPLEVEGENQEVVKRTAAFYTLLAMWEEAMPADEANKLEWADIEKSLGDWAKGSRTDIFDIIKALESNMKRGFKKIDPDTEVKMKEQIKIIRG